MLTDMCANLHKDPPANMPVFTEFISIFLAMSPASPTRDILSQTLNWASTLATAAVASATAPAAVASAPAAPTAAAALDSMSAGAD